MAVPIVNEQWMTCPLRAFNLSVYILWRSQMGTFFVWRQVLKSCGFFTLTYQLITYTVIVFIPIFGWDWSLIAIALVNHTGKIGPLKWHNYYPGIRAFLVMCLWTKSEPIEPVMVINYFVYCPTDGLKQYRQVCRCSLHPRSFYHLTYLTDSECWCLETWIFSPLDQGFSSVCTPP